MNHDLECIKEQFQKNERVCQKVVDIFTLIANKTRFRILCLLKEGDFCVGEIVDTIQISNFSNISQQLRLLSMAGILERRRDKKQVIYHLKDEKVRNMIDFLQENYLNAESDQ